MNDTPQPDPEQIVPWALEKRCDPCEGAGVIRNPAWAAWFERYLAARDRYQRTHEFTVDWYRSPEEAVLDAEKPDTGSEEIECPTCHGAGTVPTEAGNALLGFLHRHWR